MIDNVVDLIVTSIRQGHKIITFGVGGNASTAMHLSAELSGKYEQYEKPLPCICISENPCILTAITNDFGWDQVFERQIAGLARPGDVVIAFSISGKGEYLSRALWSAKSLNCQVILLNGAFSPLVQFACREVLSYGSEDTPRVQEWQLKMVHKICAEVKSRLEVETTWQPTMLASPISM